MKKLRLLSLAVAAVLCAGFLSCSEDDDDEPKNTITENTGGASGNDGGTGNARNDNGESDNGGSDNGESDNGGSDNGDSGNGYSPANPQTDEYGIAVSQEVDLGLSVNWAGWNVGTTFPEGYGGYYAWGETVKKSIYDLTTYKWYNGSETAMSKYCTKYCTSSYYGTVDNRSVLEPEDDVACMKWGNGWRMPTEEELEELHDNCTWEWITYKGVNGYKVTGKNLSNGNRNSIFLPAAGIRHGTSLIRRGSYSVYWSSTLWYGNDYLACMLYFNGSSGYPHVNNYSREFGHSVRAVKEK